MNEDEQARAIGEMLFGPKAEARSDETPADQPDVTTPPPPAERGRVLLAAHEVRGRRSRGRGEVEQLRNELAETRARLDEWEGQRPEAVIERHGELLSQLLSGPGKNTVEVDGKWLWPGIEK